MPRLTKEKWIDARVDCEVSGMSDQQIADKYNTSRIAVFNKSKKEQWERSKVDEIIKSHVKVTKKLNKLTKKEAAAVKKEITHEMKMKAHNEEFEDEIMKGNVRIAKSLTDDDADKSVKLSQSYKNLKPQIPQNVINNNTQNNINITVAEKKENLGLILGSYD